VIGKARAFGLAILLILTAAVPCTAAELRVLAAFTLKPALDAIAQQYRQGGGQVTLVYGPTPGLAKQIENGAPADLFFSADAEWMDDLAKRSLVRRDTVAQPIGNSLVLIARKGGAIKPQSIGPDLPLGQMLGNGRLAMCDPDAHPVGRYAKASLTKLGLWPSVATKIASAENPLLAVKMVARGDVPAAVVFATDALTSDQVEIVGTFPAESHLKITYPVAMTAQSKNPDAARFLDYLKSPDATAIFRRFGYQPPNAGG
jgi:molybdate transport system substrate-binding protein